MWQLHILSATQCDSYTIWWLRVVTSTHVPIQQTVNGVITWLLESKIYDIRSCFKATGNFIFLLQPGGNYAPYICHVICHITRRSELNVSYLVPRISYECVLWTCFNISILFRTYQPINRKVSVCGSSFYRLNIIQHWRWSV